ncbi:tyrosine-protein kinase receptor Tie-2-like [Pomacea canaliculata]|uniref:tyrosine-protein kinase receptor Tie-2-like n=1 Tax=Pomacea canaliculata TaxID=400727 RepID=UPI000D7352D8|nr:tyrosine-protein kinase receptor Tie-2-like [Pomacea canaliculata]
MNVPVPGIDFSSTFRLSAEDRESGIAYVKWTFTRANGTIIYEEKVPGKQAQSCKDFRECYATPTGQIFQFDQSFSVSNCHMMVEKENLATEEVTVTIEVTNAAGLVNRQIMKKKDLTALNGTEAYFPPQNVRILQLTDTSVTLTWDFPPGCFARSEIWVTYVQDGQQVQRKVHKDARQLDLTALTPDQDYDVRLVTLYGQQRSDAGRFTLRTLDSSVSGSTVAGIIIGLLLLLLLLVVLVLFVLWRKGLAFQGDIAQRRINRLRSSIHWKKKHDFVNDSHEVQRLSQNQDDLYLAPGQVWDTRPSWQIDAHRLTLLDQVTEGKFATIYKATLKSSDKTLTVAAKVLKSNFSEADSNKMMNKINFHATEVGRHENVLAMIGAVLDSTHLGLLWCWSSVRWVSWTHGCSSRTGKLTKRLWKSYTVSPGTSLAA